MSARRTKQAPKPRSNGPSKAAAKKPKRATTRARGRTRARPASGADEGPSSSDELELGIGSRVVPMGVEQATFEPEVPESHHASNDDVESQIRELEARLDGLIRGAEPQEPPPASIREAVGAAAQRVVERIAAPLPEGGVEAVKDLMSSDYYARQWGRLGMRHRSEDVDEFGLDPKYEDRLKPLLDFLYRRYFRVETTGIDNIPSDGRCLVVANHSGTLPLDGMMLRTAIRLEHPSRGELRWLAEDFIFYLPFVGAFMNRVGAVRACQENAARLLGKGSLVAVFPEGVKGIKKLYRERYHLQRFGRGGFIRLALRTQTPLVPCAIIGAEEANPMLYRIESLSKAIGLPYLPVTPTFPALGPLGLLPAPTKWRIELGEAMHFDGYGPEAADDHVLVGRLAERVRAGIQRLVDGGLGKRQSVWFG